MESKKTPFELSEHVGTAGWAGLLAIAGAFDVVAPETLSHAFKRASREHPVATGAAYAYMTAHLFGLIPEKIDPLCNFIKAVKREA